MARVLFLFLDGVGLQGEDPESNPFAAAHMPALLDLLQGRKLVAASTPFESARATLLAVDACMGVPGTPQSASGQAALLTGRNVSAEIGFHYGPKPNKAIARMIKKGTIFSTLVERGASAALLNAYPPRYYESIQSGRRLYSSIPLAVTSAGLELMNAQDLQAGRALSADFTGAGWVAQPGFPPAPVYPPHEAGTLLAALSLNYELTWFDFWPTDYAGHRATLAEAIGLLQAFDAVLDGLLEAWQDRQDLIVMTSDHGNLEDLSVRGHTRNPVPALLIGPSHLRRDFAAGLNDLTDFAPAVLRAIFGSPDVAGPKS